MGTRDGSHQLLVGERFRGVTAGLTLTGAGTRSSAADHTSRGSWCPPSERRRCCTLAILRFSFVPHVTRGAMGVPSPDAVEKRRRPPGNRGLHMSPRTDGTSLSVELIPFSSITDVDVRRCGEPDREALRRRAAHAGPISDDTPVYRIEFRAVPKGPMTGA